MYLHLNKMFQSILSRVVAYRCINTEEFYYELKFNFSEEEEKTKSLGQITAIPIYCSSQLKCFI